MRTLISTLLALVLCTAVLVQAAPPEPPAAPAPPAGDAAAPSQAPAPDQAGAPAQAAADQIPNEAADNGPIGELHLTNGTTYEIMALPRFGKFYLYLSGKLNGRTSTVISPTRMRDVRRWAGIAFTNQNDFVVVTMAKKQLHFTDAHLYLGSDDPTSYSIRVTDPETYEEKVLTVKKSDVKVLKFK